MKTDHDLFEQHAHDLDHGGAALRVSFAYGWQGWDGVLAALRAIGAAGAVAVFALADHPLGADAAVYEVVRVGRSRVDGSVRFLGEGDDPDRVGSELAARGTDEECAARLIEHLTRRAAQRAIEHGLAQVPMVFRVRPAGAPAVVPVPASSPMRGVFAVIDREVNGVERSIFTRIGSAWANRDGTIALRLDAFPVSGVLQVRDLPDGADGRGGPR